MIQTYLEMIQVSENVLKLLTITYLCCVVFSVCRAKIRRAHRFVLILIIAVRIRAARLVSVEKHDAFCTLHRDHTVSFVPDADRDMVYGRESKDIIGLLWKPGVPYPGSNQYDMLHL